MVNGRRATKQKLRDGQIANDLTVNSGMVAKSGPRTFDVHSAGRQISRKLPAARVHAEGRPLLPSVSGSM